MGAAAWGPDPAMIAARDAQLALQQEPVLRQLPGQPPVRPGPPPGYQELIKQALESADTQAQWQRPYPIAPAAWPTEPSRATLPYRPTVSGGGGNWTAPPGGWPSQGSGKANDLDVSFVPDPLDMVRRGNWPRGMEHATFQQKMNYINTMMAPHMNRRGPRDQLAQAQRLLYEQYHRRGGPF